MTALTQHPLSAAFPAMDDADFMSLVDDIYENGQREPITVLNGQVLDGWHRYRACIQADVEPKLVQFAGENPVLFVESMNLNRRHLTGSQRAAAVVACTDWVTSGANQHTGRGGEATSPPRRTNAEMAADAKVSERTIKQAKVAHRAGLGKAVIGGQLTAEAAARKARDPMAKPSRPKKARGPEAEGRDEVTAKAGAKDLLKKVHGIQA